MEEKEEVIMVRKDPKKVNPGFWIFVSLAVFIVVVGWFLIVGDQISSAFKHAKAGAASVSEAAKDIKEGTAESRGQILQAVEPANDVIAPIITGVKQRQEVLDTVADVFNEEVVKESITEIIKEEIEVAEPRVQETE